MINVQLPDAASIERTQVVMNKAEDILLRTPGVKGVTAQAGFGLLSGSNGSNLGTFFISLNDWNERDTSGLSTDAIVADLNKKFAAFPEALILVFNPPPINGLEAAGGFQFELQDRSGSNLSFLAGATDQFLLAASKRKELTNGFTSFRPNVPQVKLDVDRDKVKSLAIPLDDVFQTLQTYLGSYYVNQLNLYGRTWRVYVQAGFPYRSSPDDLGQLYVRSKTDKMVPLSTLVTPSSTTAPNTIMRYNVYRAAEISGQAAPGYSSGQAIAVMEDLAKGLPQGTGYSWTGTAYQEKESGGGDTIGLLSLLE